MSWNALSAKPVTARAAANAKTLRKAFTPPEKHLWWHLRHRIPIVGSHFRRQIAIGPYGADFCCLSARLIVEVDGCQHGTDEHVIYDARRDAALATFGFTVLRFTDADVVRQIDTVLETIVAALHEPATGRAAPSSFLSAPPPPPTSSPQGGGETAEP